ncbi:MAG: hypothetical protein H5U40_09900, partial [Polyangiaceae bacterium]|nr:hypothetical protein [Polyangiaceae bacterium]
MLRERFPAHEGAVTSTLALSALVALLAFYNLGRPQFWNAGEGRPTFIHNHDMRVYYPVAKYFRELRFDGVYAASLAALEDIDAPGSLDRMARVEFRDMTTHEMTRVGEARGTIAEVKSRFSPERWAAFVNDMRYFRHSMGLNGYLGSMHDHGANATPVWFLSALAIFAWSPASDAILITGAAIDLGLLLVAFAAIGRTFGLRTMLLSIVFFGANDFYMFGSNWAGATLRHDWMAYLALGACALRSSRYALGGVLLALAAMIRAFPALALVGVALAAGWMLIQQRSALGRPLTRAERMETLAPFFRVALGAAICVLGLWLVTSLVFGFDSWTIWLEKVALLSRDSHVNNISLRQLAIWTRQAGLSNAGA